MQFLTTARSRLAVWLSSSRRARAQEAYRRAYERHCSAVNRGDTRSIHETRPALLAAQVRRLKVGA
jgi:hypothetical protein